MELKNGTPIVVKVETIRKQDGEVSKYTETFNGQYVKMGSNIYLRYQEKHDQHEDATVTFKITNDGEVQLNRQQGEMKMRLYFASQKRVSTTYKTPYGVIPIETLTNKINISKKDMPISAKVEVDYLLYSQEKIVGEYKIRLQFTA
jgi:uncharacterized beta-barrel protein YwiB (DUF1934 family)